MSAAETVPAPEVAYDGRDLVASHGTHEPVRIVLHDTEGHDVAGTRDLAGVAAFWHGQGLGYGAHLGVDAEGLTGRYVDDREIAWHVARRNTGSLGIEQIGFAWFPLPTWLGRKDQLETVSQWLAHWSAKYGIPLRVDVEHGVSTHAMQSKTFGGTHTDPGRFYPLDRVIDRAVEIRQHPEPVKPPKDLFWLWLRWWLGEGEFRDQPRHDPRRRPAELPEKVPAAWWERAERFVAARERAAA